MPRETEERIIAYTVLVVASVAVVGWSAWVITSMQPPNAVSLAILGSILLTLVSVPASVAGVYLLQGSERSWPSIARLLALAMLAVVFLATGILVVGGAVDGLALAGLTLSLLSVWVLLPLAIGAISAATDGTSMFGVLIAWPPSNLLAMVLFVAPSPTGIDVNAGNALALAEPLRSLLVLVIVFVVVFGPALGGRLVDRVITVRVDDAVV